MARLQFEPFSDKTLILCSWLCPSPKRCKMIFLSYVFLDWTCSKGKCYSITRYQLSPWDILPSDPCKDVVFPNAKTQRHFSASKEEREAFMLRVLHVHGIRGGKILHSLLFIKIADAFSKCPWQMHDNNCNSIGFPAPCLCLKKKKKVVRMIRGNDGEGKSPEFAQKMKH